MLWEVARRTMLTGLADAVGTTEGLGRGAILLCGLSLKGKLIAICVDFWRRPQGHLSPCRKALLDGRFFGPGELEVLVPGVLEWGR